MSTFALALIALFVAVFAHELGHVLAAKIVGLRIIGFAVWPLYLFRHPDGWHVQLKTVDIVPALGWTRCVPENSARIRSRIAIATIGGPVVSLLTGVVGVGIAESRSLWIDERLNLFIWAVALWSVYVGLLSLVPLRSGDLPSDGRRLLEIAQDGKDVVRIYAINGLLDVAGRIHPRDWDPGLVALALDDSVQLKRSQPRLTSLDLSKSGSLAFERDVAPALQLLRFRWAVVTKPRGDD